MNLERAKQCLDFLKENIHHDEFYPVLLMYERLGINSKELNDKVLNEAYKITEKYETIYDESLRDDITNLKGLLTKNKEMER